MVRFESVTDNIAQPPYKEQHEYHNLPYFVSCWRSPWAIRPADADRFPSMTAHFVVENYIVSAVMFLNFSV